MPLLRCCFLLLLYSTLCEGTLTYIRPFGDEEYETMKKLVSGTFHVPVSQRTVAQNSVRVKYFRLKEKLRLDKDGNLLFEGRPVLKKSDINDFVTKIFVKNKSGGHRKIQARAADGYAGLSKREVLKVTSNDVKFRRLNVRFTNKAVPRPIRAKKVIILFCIRTNY